MRTPSPYLDPEVKALVKAADKLDAYLKCVEELKAGNTEFRKAKEQTYAALCQNPHPRPAVLHGALPARTSLSRWTS